MRRIAVLAIVALLSPAVVPAAEPDMSRFLGSWSVDYDRTMERAKESPKFSEQDEKMSVMLQQLMEVMKMKITEREMVYIRGPKETPVAYMPKTQTKDVTTVSCSVGEHSFDVNLSLIDGAFLSLKSSGSDDMDFIVWKRDK